MGKKTKLSIVAFVIFVIGGIIMFSLNQKREQTEAQQIHHEQERIALYLVNHYEGIHRIEFNDMEKNEVTGSRNVLLTINKEVKMEITFFKFNDKTDNYVISWYKKLGLTEKNAATNLKAINDVEVKYWSK